MSTLQIVLLAAVAVSLVATFIMKMPSAGDRKQARKRLADAPWLDESTPDGTYAKIQGVVRMREHGERFVSPVTEDRCVVLRVRVQVRHGVDPRAKLVESFQITPFVVEDADGKILVDATHALLDVTPAKQPTRYTPRKEKALAEMGYDEANPNKSEFEETMVEVGATVTVAGTYSKVGDEVKITGDKDKPIAIKVDRARADIDLSAAP